MSTVSTSPRATEDSVTPRPHSLTEGQKPGWTWMAVAAAAAVVAAGLTVLLSGAFNVVGFVIIAAILYIAGLYVATRVMENAAPQTACAATSCGWRSSWPWCRWSPCCGRSSPPVCRP